MYYIIMLVLLADHSYDKEFVLNKEDNLVLGNAILMTSCRVNGGGVGGEVMTIMIMIVISIVFNFI